MSDPEAHILRLVKPIEAHGSPVTELKLRRPTGRELITHGQPYVVVGSAGGGIKADYRACAGLISAICEIPPSAVDQLDAADLDEAAMVLVGFTKRARVATGTETGSDATR